MVRQLEILTLNFTRENTYFKAADELGDKQIVRLFIKGARRANLHDRSFVEHNNGVSQSRVGFLVGSSHRPHGVFNAPLRSAQRKATVTKLNVLPVTAPYN